MFAFVFAVDPLLHNMLPLQPVAVKVAFSPSQHTVLSVVTIGLVGVFFGSILIVFELADVPQLVVHVAV